MEPLFPNREKLPDHLLRLNMVLVWVMVGAAFFLHFVVVGVKTGPRATVVTGVAALLDVFLLAFIASLIGRAGRNYRFRFTLAEMLLYVTIIAFACAILRGIYLWVAAEPVVFDTLGQ